jgi:hypothetical protein
MSVVRTSRRTGKKPALTNAARGSARKPASKKTKTGAKTSGAKPPQKGNSRSSAKYSSVKSKQMAVESAKRSIWASMQDITKALITNATGGNLSTAKELFDFAGVYSLTEPEDENAAVAAQPILVPAPDAPAAEPAKVHPIDLFLNRIGVAPSTAQPESEVA